MMMHRLLPTDDGRRDRRAGAESDTSVVRRHVPRVNRVLIVSFLLRYVLSRTSSSSFVDVIAIDDDDVANRPSNGGLISQDDDDDNEDGDQVFGEWGQLRMSA